jgi:hypothetical protein
MLLYLLTFFIGYTFVRSLKMVKLGLCTKDCTRFQLVRVLLTSIDAVVREHTKSRTKSKIYWPWCRNIKK